MTKQDKRSWQYLLALLLVLALLLAPGTAWAADDDTVTSETPGTPETQTEPFWDDLSYVQFLVRNYAFYDLDPQVLQAKDVPSLVTALQKTDPWAHYFAVEEFATYWDVIEGDYIGIGVYVRIEKDQLVILGAIAGSPAEKAGLKNGDVIVGVDGLSAPGATAEQLLEALSGEENSMITIKYKRDGRVISEIMNRKRVVNPSMEYWMLEDGIGYLLIWQFTTHTGEELKAGVKSLKQQGMKSLLVDLRDCPGGEVEGAVDVCSVLCGAGPMVFFVGNEGWLDFIPVNEPATLGMPLAVLINGETASAAELVAANVQDSGSGVVIGVSSFGKGVIQHLVQLPSGAGFSFTTEKYMTHSYQDIDSAGGVLPDIYVTDEEAQQDTAINWLKEQLAQPTFLKFYVGLNGYSWGGEWQNGSGALIQDGNAYVPLATVLERLGWQRREYQGVLYYEHQGQRLIVDVAAGDLITSDGSEKLLDQGGVIYAPAAFLRQFSYTVTWDNAERSVRVDK